MYYFDGVEGGVDAHLVEETGAGVLSVQGRVGAVDELVGGFVGEGAELDFHQARDVGFGGGEDVEGHLGGFFRLKKRWRRVKYRDGDGKGESWRGK